MLLNIIVDKSLILEISYQLENTLCNAGLLATLQVLFYTLPSDG